MPSTTLDAKSELNEMMFLFSYIIITFVFLSSSVINHLSIKTIPYLSLFWGKLNAQNTKDIGMNIWSPRESTSTVFQLFTSFRLPGLSSGSDELLPIVCKSLQSANPFPELSAFQQTFVMVQVIF